MKMKRRGRCFILALLLTGSAAGLVGQSFPLNPTVKVRPRATTPVPAECDESLAPQPAPRIQVEEIPVTERGRTADLQPPPARGLRDQLAEAQAAVERNDRTAFTEWLALAKATAAAYPPGGDRTNATNTIAVYDDVFRLWDYQFASPTGAFFDATVQNGSLLAAMQRYPGYDAFIARQTITDANGTRFYPTRESREFLARTAAQRLERMGVRAATAPRPAPQPGLTPEPDRAATEPAVRTETQPRTATPAPAPAARSRRPTRKTTSSTASSSTRRATTTASSSTPRATSTTSSSTPRATSKRAVTKPAPAPVTTTIADELPIPSGIVTAPAAGTFAPIAPPPAAPDTGTMATATADTTSVATPEPAPRPVRATESRGRNLVFPLLLILIGVGVLILLFRASA